MPEEIAEWLTVEDVANRLKFNAETVRRFIRRGELRAINFGGSSGYRITERDFQEFITKKRGTQEEERPAA